MPKFPDFRSGTQHIHDAAEEFVMDQQVLTKAHGVHYGNMEEWGMSKQVTKRATQAADQLRD